MGSDFKKWPLPEEVPVRQLNTKYDAVLKTLNLQEKQETAIQDAKSKILKRIGTLQKAQTEARSAYQSCANCPSTAARFAARVKSAAAACKAYDPNRDYQLAIRRQLNLKQESGFHEALSEQR